MLQIYGGLVWTVNSERRGFGKEFRLVDADKGIRLEAKSFRSWP